MNPMRDTSPAAEEVRLDAIRRAAPIQRLVEALELSESVRALALSRLRELHPGRTERELVDLLVGSSVASRPAPPAA